MRRTPGRVAALATLALLLGACGGEPTDSPSALPPATASSAPAPSPPSPSTASPSPAAAPTATPSATITAPATETAVPEDDTWALAEQTANFPGGGGPLLPVAVRTGAHDGYDRVVFDLSGDGEPGWRVTYVERAIDDPRGQEIDLDGEAVSEIVITGLRYPEESEYDSVLGSGTVEVDDLDQVEEIHVSGIFEGQLQVLVGLEEEVEFRVLVLQDPVRLVVDYRTD